MIESLFRSALVRRRMIVSHLGIIIQDFVLHLHSQGHVLTCIQAYEQAVEHFSRWLESQKVEIASISDSTVDRFLRFHLPRCHCPRPATTNLKTCRAALRSLMIFMRQKSLIQPSPIAKVSHIDQIVNDYDQHLRVSGGLAPNTRLYLRRYAREFLKNRGRKDLRRLTPKDIMGYIQSRAPGLKPASLRVMARALRSFLRFLNLKDYICHHIISAVPTPAPWPRSLPPEILNEDQLRAFLKSFIRTTPTGRRDFAMAQCFYHLGLRTSEVAAIRIEDIDWNNNLLRVATSKQRKERLIPLPNQVSSALLDYVTRGRPVTKAPTLFVRHRAPFGSSVDVHHVRSAMRRAFTRAGIPSSKIHLLRHTFATRLHRRGIDLKSIADFLGHQSLNTTAGYARVNIQELRTASLPWPEEKP